MWDLGMQTTAANDPNPNAGSAEVKLARRQVHCFITKLSDNECKKFRKQVATQGAVEPLLRAIVNTYEQKNEASLSALRKRLISVRLRDYKDFEELHPEILTLADMIEDQSGETVSDSQRRFVLLEAMNMTKSR